MEAASRPRVCYEFEVEKIIGVSSDGKYQVQWAPAWVSKSVLIGCDHLIHEFLQQECERDSEDQSGFSLQTSINDVDVEPVSEFAEPCVAIKIEDDHFDQNIQSESNEQTLLPPTPSEVREENTYLDLSDIEYLSDIHRTVAESIQHLPIFNADDELDEHRYGHKLSSTSSKIPSEFGELDKVVNNCGSLVTDCFSGRCSTTDTLRKGQINSSLSEEQLHNTATSRPTCSVCHKQFTHMNQLVRHLRTHTAHKSYECPHCQKKFTHRSRLTRHLPIHTGERPYSCNYCNYSCIQKIQLTLHIRTRHTREKPYPCEVCKKPFTSMSDKNKHLQLCAKKNQQVP